MCNPSDTSGAPMDVSPVMAAFASLGLFILPYGVKVLIHRLPASLREDLIV
jgi:hypothetical protein